MIGPVHPRLLAAVGDGERPVITAAAEQIVGSVSAVIGTAWPIRLRFIEADAPAEDGVALVATWIGEAMTATAPDIVETRWRRRIAAWRVSGVPRVLLCTLFRHVDRMDGGPATVEHIRRLNRIAIALSRAAGVEIVDIDRVFAQVGARTLDSDYRMRGPGAAALAGHAIADALLRGDLGDRLDPTVQQSALEMLGG